MELSTSVETPGFRVQLWSEATTLQFPNIGVLCRWSRVGVLEHMTTDTEIALFLLKRYEDTLKGILFPIRCSACRKSMELRIKNFKCSSCLRNVATGDAVPTLLATDVAQRENTGSTVNIGYTENTGHERQAKDAGIAEQTDNCNTSCSEKADSHSAQPLNPIVHAATNSVNIPQGLECIKTEPLSETEARPHAFHPEIREDKLCTPPPVESTNTDDLPDINTLVHAFTGIFNSAHGCVHNGIKTEAAVELESNRSDFAASEQHRDCASEKEFDACCVSDSTSLEYTGNVNLPIHAATNTVYTARGCTSKGIKVEVVSHYQTDEVDFHGDNDKQNTTAFSDKRLLSPDISIFRTQTDFIKKENVDDSESETSDLDAKTKHRDPASSVSQPQITHLTHEHGANVSTVSRPRITHTMQNENIISVSSNSTVSQPQITHIIPNQHGWNVSRPQVMYLAQNIHNAGEGDNGTTPQLQSVCIAANVLSASQSTPMTGWQMKRTSCGSFNDGITITKKPRQIAPKPLCVICGSSFSHISALDRHMQAHRAKTQAKLTQSLTKQTHSLPLPLTCTICNRKFAKNSSLVTHMRTHDAQAHPKAHLRDSFRCTRTFPESDALCEHKRARVVEKKLKRMDSAGKPLDCAECKQGEDFTRDIAVHPYLCTVCNSSFRHKCTLLYHLRDHEVDSLMDKG